MATELNFTRDGDTMRFARSDMDSGLYRILIPKGTHLWWVGITTYLVDEPATATAAFDAPPTGSAEPAGHDLRNTLQKLWDGATLSFYSPGNSGTLTMSAPESTSQFRADRDRWLYIQFSFPSGKVQKINSQIQLWPGEAPAPDPVPDLALAQRTLDYAHRSGLVKALMLTAGARNDGELIDWMQRQGDLWFSLCRLADLAEQKAATSL